MKVKIQLLLLFINMLNLSLRAVNEIIKIDLWHLINYQDNFHYLRPTLNDLKYKNHYAKFYFLERFLAKVIADFMKGAPRFEVDNPNYWTIRTLYQKNKSPWYLVINFRFFFVVSKWDNKIITNILEWKCGQLADHLPTKNLTKFPLRNV